MKLHSERLASRRVGELKVVGPGVSIHALRGGGFNVVCDESAEQLLYVRKHVSAAKMLHCRGDACTEIGLKAIASLAIEVLNLNCPNVGAHGFGFLRRMRSLVDLSMTVYPGQEPAIDFIARSPTIRELNIYCARGVDLSRLQPIESMSHLKYFEVTNCDSELTLEFNMPELRELHISACAVTKHVLCSIGKSRWLEICAIGNTFNGSGLEDGIRAIALIPRLRELSLYFPEMPAPGLDALPGIKKLRQLSVHEFPLTHAHLDVLSQMTQLTNLIVRKRGLTKKRRTQLEAALPNCEVLWWS